MNDLLLKSIQKTEQEIDKNFYNWSARKQPFIHFSLHEGKLTSNDMIWDDDIQEGKL